MMKGINVTQVITIENTKPVLSIDDIKNAKRLFYELGHHPIKLSYNIQTGEYTSKVVWSKWVGENIFKEITDIEDMLKHDKELTNPEYLKHHNFRYI